MAQTSLVRIIDSHTAGEPTRIVIDGGPDLGHASLAARRDCFRTCHDRFRTAVLLEPRGSEVLVGGLLCPPDDPSSAAAVIFFNDVGYLGMCGHGMIGLVHTLAHLGRISAGRHTIETPVGPILTTLHSSGEVSVRNVPSCCIARNVRVQVPGFGALEGSVAYGGNWFFVVDDHPFALNSSNREELLAATLAVRAALAEAGITGLDGAPIEHIELCALPRDARNSARNFVLCPGVSFDRSPCGTGTSAKLACLHAEGKLQPGQVWRQEGILDTVFEGSIEPAGAGVEPGWVIPIITGRAYITAEAHLFFDPADPFPAGIVF